MQTVLKVNTNSSFRLDDYLNHVLYVYLYDYFDEFIKENHPQTKDGDPITAKMLIDKLESYSVWISMNALPHASDILADDMTGAIEKEVQKINSDFKITNFAYDKFLAEFILWTESHDPSFLHANYQKINDIINEEFAQYSSEVIKAMNSYLNELFSTDKLIKVLIDYIDFSDDEMIFMIEDICNDPDRALTEKYLKIGTCELEIMD